MTHLALPPAPDTPGPRAPATLSRPALSRLLAPAAASLLCLAWLSPPAAAASLETARGSLSLQEAQFTYDVEFRGAVAVVESTQVLTNPGKHAEEAVYTFDLPVNAAVVGVRVNLSNGRTTRVSVVDTEAALQVVPDAGSVNAAPDVGLLRLVGRDVPRIEGPSPYAVATYELRVYPVPPGKTVAVTTEWVAPLQYDDGRLSLRIPQRGNPGNLVRERVSLRLRPPAGARRFAAVHGGGKQLGKGIKRARFRARPRRDVVIEAIPDFGPRPSLPAVSFATTPIRDDFGVVGVSVLAPGPRGRASLDYERALLLVDVSRSLGARGLEAAAALSDELLAHLPANAEVEVILFDRVARRVFGSFIDNGADTRKDVARALRPGRLRNGSNLGDALEMARSALLADPLGMDPRPGLERGDRAPTLVAILSDGMLPLELDSRGAIDRMGEDLLQDVEILSVLLVPDSAPAPDTDASPLGKLAYRTPGRAIAVRFGEATARNLPAELGGPTPLRNLRLDTGTTVVEGIELPATLEAGQGLVRLGFYHGIRPKKLALAADQSARRVRIAARPGLGLGRASLPLALVNASPEDFIPRSVRVDSDPDAVYSAATLEAARRRLVKAASRAAVITRHTAMVALDRGDRFARDRLALVQRWGPGVFFRLPPPPERVPGYELRAFERRVDGAPVAAGGDGTRRTGALDRGIIERLIDMHVAPKARACYEKALRRHRNLSGSLVIVLEIARGEVQHARVERSSFPNVGIEPCVISAAYSIHVPLVALGDDPETIGVARYPLAFKKREGQGHVHTGDEPRSVDVSPDDPLGGLRNP